MIAHDNDSLEKKLICILEVCIKKKKRKNHTNENQMPKEQLGDE